MHFVPIETETKTTMTNCQSTLLPSNTCITCKYVYIEVSYTTFRNNKNVGVFPS